MEPFGPAEIRALREALAHRVSPEWLSTLAQALNLEPGSLLSSDIYTEEEKEGYREQFTEKKEVCVHCGGLHLRACRRVRRLVMKNKEDVAEVEFWADGYWDESGIVWPEDVFGDEETGTEEKADGEDNPPAP